MSLFDGKFCQQDDDDEQLRLVHVLMINDAVMGAVDSEEKKIPYEAKIRAKEREKAYLQCGRLNHQGVESYMHRFIFHWNTVPFNDI